MSAVRFPFTPPRGHQNMMTSARHPTTAGAPSRAGYRRGWQTAIAAGLVTLSVWAVMASAVQDNAPPASGHTPASSPPAASPQVLVIFSDDASQSWIQQLTNGFNVAATGPGAPAWFFEYLDAVRFQDDSQGHSFLRGLREKYRGRHLDLVVAIASNAIAFTVNARDDLWPDVPVLFANYGGMVPADASGLRNASSLSFEYGFETAMAAAKTLFPDTTAVVVSSGFSALERVRETSEVGDSLRRAGLEFLDLGATSTADALARAAHLPPQTLLFIAGGQVDMSGTVVPSWRVCELMSAAANRPTLMLGAQFLGCGIVGGLMRDYLKIGTMIGQRAIAAASGAWHGAEIVPFAAISVSTFDARQLARWQVDETRLPAGSIVAFREPSLWRDYRWAVLFVAGALLIQATLIAGLLYQLRQRRKAEIESRRSLSLAAHGDRQAAMAVLTGSIAHELSQPLSAILHNAEAAEMLVAANRASAPELREILRDIRTEDERASGIVQRHRAMLRKHDLERRSLDIHSVIRESLALVVRDAGERQVRIDADAPAAPCFVLGDQILLQQVVVNLVINAMDAMAAVPPGSRRVTVRQEVTRDRVEISIRDSGPGLPVEINGRLFEPFMTTKPNGIGIGLTITRSIIEAFGGTIAGGNNPDGGATFRFALPRALGPEGAHL